MERALLQLLEGYQDVPRRIREIVARSTMRECEKVAYAVKLINIARKHNLI